MKKGLYSGIIALSALVLAVALTSSASQAIAAKDAAIYENAIVDVKTSWQNARAVLDELTSESIAEHIETNGCLYSDPSAQLSADYFTALDNMWDGKCTFISANAIETVPGQVDVDARFSCALIFGTKFSALYDQRTTFSKSYDTSGLCVTVTDIASGRVEATRP